MWSNVDTPQAVSFWAIFVMQPSKYTAKVSRLGSLIEDFISRLTPSWHKLLVDSIGSPTLATC
jgi:hypothetical protein